MGIIFWMMLAFSFYTYLIYPLILCLWSIIVPRKLNKDINHVLTVSVVIAACNEEKNIERRIRNLVSQDYPMDKVEIIIVSDGSTDRTNMIVERLKKEINNKNMYRNNFLSLLSYNPSQGKPYAINLGLNNAKGEIIVFADCRQRFSTDTIRQLVANFCDEEVGCVSGELIFEDTQDSTIDGEMMTYWNFEKYIRKLESRTGSVPGVTGAVYAIRKKLFQFIPMQTLLDDVLIPLNTCLQGYRVVFDSDAKAFDFVSKDIEQEKNRKVRTLAGNWQLLILQPNLLNPIKNPLWFKFISHKIFRLLVPFSALILVLSTFFYKSNFSILIQIFFALSLFTFIVSPILKCTFPMMSKICQINRTVIILNFFALIAPLRLISSSKKLW